MTPDLRAVKRRPVTGDGAGMATTGTIAGAIPLVEPVLPGLDPAAWLAGARATVDALLLAHGAMLLRGFAPCTVDDFARAVRALSPGLLAYDYASTPRTRLGPNVYSATDYPATETIPQHHEMAYARRWPLRLFFCCREPAATGGRTPLSPSREVLARIPERVRRRFAERGVLYVRNYGGGVDLPWETVFGSGDRAAVEACCRRLGIAWEWKPDGGLRTRQACQGVARHPRTGELVWFNQAHLFHVSALAAPVRETLLASFAPEDLPRNAYHGDGSAIAEDDLAAVRAAYAAGRLEFEWARGDLLLLDNMLMAHGRTPFTGRRAVLVAMSDPHEPADGDRGGGA